MIRRSLALAVTTVLTATTLAACGSPAEESGATGAPGPEDGTETVDVVVGFYPLQYTVERIGGDRVAVTNLTRPGADPHDAELSPRDVATVSEASLAVYEAQLQPAVDEAIASQEVEHRLDVAEAAQLDRVVDQPIVDVSAETGDGGAEGHDDHDHAHENEGDSDHTGHDHEVEAGSVDPHFWLDPVRYEQVARRIATSLAEVDPDGASEYEQNLEALTGDLQALHGEFEDGLAECSSTTLVTSHAAFGYLAARYGFEQAAISGLSPEAEPDPRRLSEVATYAREHDVSVIYAETLSSPAVAETVANETGARTAVLDPIEGLTDEGGDYLSLMRDNLETLRDGQGCR